ncbi:hypothetical protein [Leuconostoc pseudomesenteroides]|uniref:hypothetical protein n=1 Tax=Leuconostoc pseudomesenteroides TaxID=33968 RepID=UPI0039E94129
MFEEFEKIINKLVEEKISPLEKRLDELEKFNPTSSEYLSVYQAYDLLKGANSYTTSAKWQFMNKLVKNGDLHKIMFGEREWKVKRTEIEEYMEARSVTGRVI